MIIKKITRKKLSGYDYLMVSRGHALFIIKHPQNHFTETLKTYCKAIEISADHENIANEIVKHRNDDAVLVLHNFNNILFLKYEMDKRTKGIIIIKN